MSENEITKEFDIIKITKAGFYCKSKKKFDTFTKFNAVFQFMNNENKLEENLNIEGVVVDVKDIEDKNYPYLLTVYLFNFDPLNKEKYEKLIQNIG